MKYDDKFDHGKQNFRSDPGNEIGHKTEQAERKCIYDPSYDLREDLEYGIEQDEQVVRRFRRYQADSEAEDDGKKENLQISVIGERIKNVGGNDTDNELQQPWELFGGIVRLEKKDFQVGCERRIVDDPSKNILIKPCSGPAHDTRGKAKSAGKNKCD